MNKTNELLPRPKRLLVVELILLVLPAFSIFFVDRAFCPFILITCLCGLLTWLLALFTVKKTNAFSSGQTKNQFLLLIIMLQYGAVLAMTASITHAPISGMSITTLLLGLLFIILGNLLGKLSPNTMIGIRTTWALENRENWNYSSRVSGIVWVIGGLLCWLTLLFRIPMAGFVLILLLAFAPLLISYAKYKEQVRAGTWKKDLDLSTGSSLGKGGKIAIILFTIGLIAFVLFALIGGKNYTIDAGADDLSIRSTLAGSVQIPYEDMKSVRLKEAGDPGNRDCGYAAFGIDLGHYSNAEYGKYRRYTSTSPIVIEIRGDGETLVCSLDAKEKTEQLFEQIEKKIQ